VGAVLASPMATTSPVRIDSALPVSNSGAVWPGPVRVCHTSAKLATRNHAILPATAALPSGVVVWIARSARASPVGHARVSPPVHPHRRGHRWVDTGGVNRPGWGSRGVRRGRRRTMRCRAKISLLRKAPVAMLALSPRVAAFFLRLAPHKVVQGCRQATWGWGGNLCHVRTRTHTHTRTHAHTHTHARDKP